MNPRLTTLATTATIAFASTAALGQFVIEPAQNYVVGTQPSGVAMADFDNDGDLDLATTVDDPDRVMILINGGNGLFAMGPAAFLPGSSSPQDVAAADFDGDGDTDLAVAVRDPQGAVVIMVNSGSGTFTNGGSVTVGERPRGLAVGDHDNDGDMDIAVANRDSDNASVLTNNGVGGFSVATLASGAEPRQAAFGDFDLDGDLDLAVTNHDDRSISTYTNNGGTFTPGTVLFVSPLVRPEGIAAGDLDNDGDADLAVAVSDQTLGINEAVIFTAGGAGFAGPFGYATGGTNTGQITIADLDCDGMSDVVTSNQDSGNISALRNLGGAVFGAPQVILAGTSPGEITSGDIDGDGDADVAVANRDSNNVSIFENGTCQPATPCPADITGDGFVAVEDLVTLILAWGPNPGHVADLDGDGMVGVTDLSQMILSWGACP